jgi:hypothetical protein
VVALLAVTATPTATADASAATSAGDPADSPPALAAGAAATATSAAGVDAAALVDVGAPSPTGVAGSAAVANQVSADQGQYVTSDSARSRYYYARDDTGWHRIHAEHQVWFRTVADLLAAFPHRKLHLARTRHPRATRTPTPTPTQ